jgi:hypothetical protein
MVIKEGQFAEHIYTHSLGAVAPNVIIIYYILYYMGIGEPIGQGTQAHRFRRYVGYVGYECFLHDLK